MTGRPGPSQTIRETKQTDPDEYDSGTVRHLQKQHKTNDQPLFLRTFARQAVPSSPVRMAEASHPEGDAPNEPSSCMVSASASVQATSAAAPVNASPKTPRKTPAKKECSSSKLTPAKCAPQKKKKKKIVRPEGFGGAVGRADECKVCQSERDEDQIGGTCRYCLLACRKQFNHQRITAIVACPENKELLIKDSLALRPKKAKKPRKRGTEDMLELVSEQLGKVMPCLDNILLRLDRLEAAGATKAKGK